MIQIQAGSFQECVDLSNQIPEFDSPYELDEYEKRCAGSYLLLNAFVDENPLGLRLDMIDSRMEVFTAGWVVYFLNTEDRK